MSSFRSRVICFSLDSRTYENYPEPTNESIFNDVTSAQYYLPAAEIVWGLFTLGTAFVRTYNQLVVMRFFVGLSAASCYVGCLHVLNSYVSRVE